MPPIRLLIVASDEVTGEYRLTDVAVFESDPMWPLALQAWEGGSVVHPDPDGRTFNLDLRPG